ncbi:MAG: hypothetical protein KC505_10630 [Myxococcales bacterium]|nr:hypothetical protein [Myxococcales bacterium]USN51096.1 MAG: hypothetical protein H6731_01415 [Myxococcales bacterium]
MKKIISSVVGLFLLATLFNFQVQASPNMALRYPLRAIERPSVTPVGIISIEPRANGLKKYDVDLNTRFGIAEKIEGQFGYDGVTFNDPNSEKSANFKKTVTAGIRYNYLSINQISASLDFKLPIHIFDGEIIKDVTIGLPTVFYNDLMAGGILGDVFWLQMRDNIEMSFDLAWWYGIQVYGNLWADISSSLGKFQMKNPNKQATWENLPFWKELPLTLTLLYCFNPFVDMTLSAGFDNALKAKDTFNVGLGFNFRAGKLFG